MTAEMKLRRKKWKLAGGILLAVQVLLAGGFFWHVSDYYRAEDAALDNRALLADVGGRFYGWPDPGVLYAADGVHPSELGSHIAAETIAAVIRHREERMQ